ncbi:CbiQ family ECF transporter T component [Nonomuraea sp. NPDC049709]|uniref:CbiQ family ECF transporter T component n=1 Tax=Nonomuraea sp. NPDC049709 TaxID=3154736 RepID=UPI00342F2A5B
MTTAALRAACVPRAISVSAAVMLWFLPVIVTEARAVHDAMRLRGIGVTDLAAVLDAAALGTATLLWGAGT